MEYGFGGVALGAEVGEYDVLKCVGGGLADGLCGFDVGEVTLAAADALFE